LREDDLSALEGIKMMIAIGSDIAIENLCFGHALPDQSLRYFGIIRLLLFGLFAIHAYRLV